MENGKTFLPQVIPGQPLFHGDLQHLEFSQSPVDFIANDFALISLCKTSSLRSFGKTKVTVQERLFVCEDGVWALGTTVMTYKDRDGFDQTTTVQNPRLAIQNCQGRQALILCNIKGKVERLSRSIL